MMDNTDILDPSQNWISWGLVHLDRSPLFLFFLENAPQVIPRQSAGNDSRPWQPRETKQGHQEKQARRQRHIRQTVENGMH